MKTSLLTRPILLKGVILCILISAAKIGSACDASFGVQVAGTTVYFTNTSQGSYPMTFYWSFGDGTTSAFEDPVHQYNSTGPFIVCLTIVDSSNCQDTHCDSIYLSGSCNAAYTYQQNGSDFVFTNTSSNYMSAHWSFGDGTFSTQINPVHTFPGIGNYYVCLTITDSNNLCSDTYCQYINVPLDSGCAACFSLQINNSTVSFFDCSQSSSQISSWQWSFGDNTSSTQQNPIHTYNGLGDYVVCLTITDSLGCSATWCDSVYLGNMGCQAYFTSSINGSSVQFYNQSTGNYTASSWSFGDGTSSSLSDPQHTYTTNGTYMVCLTIYDSLSCQSTSCQWITIGGGNNMCTAGFILVPDSLQQGLYWGYNLSTGNNLSYFWTWGDGTSSTGQYPSHVYTDSGYYNICLVIYDSLTQCTDTFCTSYNILKMEGLMNIHQIIFLDPAAGLPVNNHPTEILWSIFPNPAERSFMISSNGKTIDEIRITDVNGKDIELITGYSGNNIAIKDLSPGVYIVQALIDGERSSKLLVKQ